MARTITYAFAFQDGVTRRYELNFDDQHRLLPRASSSPASAWTALGFQQCTNCPLKAADSPLCPVAQNIDHIVEDTKDTVSYTRAVVTVHTPERTYSAECATQDGLRSLFGLIMACSGCPHLDWLRPLARFHLPFADPDETLFRVLGLQLVGSFLADSNSTFADSIAQTDRRYEEVKTLNQCFIKRIRIHCRADADKNALAALDLFAQFFTLDRDDNFEMLRTIFGQQKKNT
ncbi:MAG: hypothetical protein JNK23_07570 [Opitutaceae bacterium]|nr:hypothetical protein [Opitutaceae bacterium]